MRLQEGMEGSAIGERKKACFIVDVTDMELSQYIDEAVHCI